ncbi:hypothetical protein BT67DRAFT_381952 [Trichocladium antarcticum]|uniref:DNA/RNA-binding protein Alba-like domain-containing protein n=1 Tax=Trichocladium antarcticum TaxID=1450529 RepID=A0AAN6ULB7_9PEZI|nr:hypothetical protein BT67DRAFT_381952 [Trichocladium antarcticum]
MATQDALHTLSQSSSAGKRKSPSDNIDLNPKKRRAADPRAGTCAETQRQNSTSISSPYNQVYIPVLSKISPKFNVRTMSVMPSTNISKHVDTALNHLGRFSTWNQKVLPGVVLLCAKSAASGKLITISELIRRRIGESDQKWFQYNVLSETVMEAARPVEQPSVVEDTFVATDPEGEECADDGYFETKQPTIHEQAVQPAKVMHKPYMTTLLSRVPLDELKTEQNVSLQTNEQHIEHQRKKNMGLAG